jgi:hypothetical protein
MQPAKIILYTMLYPKTVDGRQHEFYKTMMLGVRPVAFSAVGLSPYTIRKVYIISLKLFQ